MTPYVLFVCLFFVFLKFPIINTVIFKPWNAVKITMEPEYLPQPNKLNCENPIYISLWFLKYKSGTTALNIQIQAVQKGRNGLTLEQLPVWEWKGRTASGSLKTHYLLWILSIMILIYLRGWGIVEMAKEDTLWDLY